MAKKTKRKGWLEFVLALPGRSISLGYLRWPWHIEKSKIHDLRDGYLVQVTDSKGVSTFRLEDVELADLWILPCK